MYLKEYANEGSTFIINVDLKDEAGMVVLPKTLTWKLLNSESSIINERDGVVVALPEESTPIVLSGDDLAINGTAVREERSLVVTATYDSILGADLPVIDEYRFFIQNLRGV